MDNKALGGVKVIELMEGVGGPYCGKMLADMGAEVIKIEKPGTGDYLREVGPFLHGEEDKEKSCAFFYVNTDKKSVTLDLEKEEGRKILLEMLKDADVFLHSGQPEWYNEHGLGWEDLHKMNPRMVVVSMTPYGESGPWKNYKSNPLNVIHMSGMASINPLNSWEGFSRPPVMEGGNFEQYDVGAMATIGVLAAIYDQNATGEGQYMELAEVEAILQISNTQNNDYAIYGICQDRRGERLAWMGSSLMPAKDGWVCPYFVQDHECKNLALMLGHEDWIEDGWILDALKRAEHMDELRGTVIDWMKDKTRVEACDIAQKHKVAMAPIFTAREAMESEQLEYRHFFAEVDHPVWGKTKVVDRPFVMEGSPITIERAAPTLGQDTEAVLADMGITGDQVAKLKTDGVI